MNRSKRTVCCTLFVLLAFLSSGYAREIDELEEQQYLGYHHAIDIPETQKKIEELDKVIAIKPESKWSGRAILWKGILYLNITKNYKKAEEMALTVLNNYGGLLDPQGLIFIPRGWDPGQPIAVSFLNKYSITLEQSARLLLAEIYKKAGRTDEALEQLKLLTADKTVLSGIRSELKSEEEFKLMKDNWWPQQKALTMMMTIYEEKGDYNSAADIGEEISQYGNYTDINVYSEKIQINRYLKLKEYKKAKEIIEKRLNRLNTRQGFEREKEILQQQLKMCK